MECYKKMPSLFPYLLVFCLPLVVFAESLNFNRDIRPILSENCFYCHGVDGNKREADLRLDLREDAIEGGAIVPGDLEESEMYYRIHSTEEDEIMPPPDSNRILSSEQKKILDRWILEGAKYERHWAFVAPQEKTPPKVKQADWVRNPIDSFVLEKQEENNLSPSPEARKETLVKRLYADLIGLPPSPEEVDAYVKDTSSGAYEKVVDHLLASPHYGERMAMEWLDAARYADSNGFQFDGETYQWIWRDWVVNALNEDMPFDQFTIWQLAGDLLPDASTDQKIASGFNRNHLNNGEGGAIPEEQRFVILFDRMDVTSTTWLGLTMACAQCHDHKYDPITARDYYGMMDAFNHVSESGRPGQQSKRVRVAAPFIELPTEENKVKIKEFEQRIAKLRQESQERVPFDPKASPLPRRNGPVQARFVRVTNDTPKGVLHLAEVEIYSGGVNLALEAKASQSSQFGDASANRAIDGNTNGKFGKKSVTHTKDETKPWLEIDFGAEKTIDQIKVYNRRDRLEQRLKNFWVVAYDAKREPLWASRGEKAPVPLWEADLPQSFEEFDKEQNRTLQTFIQQNDPKKVKATQKQIKKLEKQLSNYKGDQVPKVMVMNDAKKRPTHILNRGEYLNKGEEVSFATPAFLPPMQEGLPKDRLGLAKWLVSRDNPLTSRVQVNRMWQRFFGVGLVKTSEDLGVQSEYPVHMDLLDWLAVQFQDLGWSQKKMHRLIVTSSAYRQSSRMNEWHRENDPDNRLVNRASRFRMPSMVLRDWALASSGLLQRQLGGSPVYPYQPEKVWEALAVNKGRTFDYPNSQGDDLYRRSLYTFWRRTIGPVNMFDSSDRQACRVKPGQTSTPLHALTTLNDPTWVEAARFLAEQVMQEKDELPERIEYAFRLVNSEIPSPSKLDILKAAYEEQVNIYHKSPDDAEKLLAVGDKKRNPNLPLPEHAALTNLCLAILNLDQSLTRE
ncbi:DUF1553 domain-containing protein [Candidatus Chordibacter forsetii]|uniref:DUF1553 domain-containing protein n=1 Tax=Candidatus Chordibacter forsetii TaxID=3381758 RepID=UPI00389A3FEC